MLLVKSKPNILQYILVWGVKAHFQQVILPHCKSGVWARPLGNAGKSGSPSHLSAAGNDG